MITFFRTWGRLEQGILLGDQFVYMLFVKVYLSHCPELLSAGWAYPVFIHEKHSYGIQSRQLYAVCQQRRRESSAVVACFMARWYR